MFREIDLGKFGAICTEFPLATFTAKILTRLSKKISRKKLFVKHAMLKD